MRTLRRTAAACALLMAGTSAHACMTLHEAACAAIAEARPLSAEFEYGGVLFAVGGCYAYSAPQTSGDKHNVTIRALKPAGATLAGIYHTHPGRDERRTHEFSPNDVRVQAAMRVPSFIGVVSTGEVYVLTKTPNRSRRTSVTGDVPVYGLAIGELRRSHADSPAATSRGL